MDSPPDLVEFAFLFFLLRYCNVTGDGHVLSGVLLLFILLALLLMTCLGKFHSFASNQELHGLVIPVQRLFLYCRNV